MSQTEITYDKYEDILQVRRAAEGNLRVLEDVKKVRLQEQKVAQQSLYHAEQNVWAYHIEKAAQNIPEEAKRAFQEAWAFATKRCDTSGQMQNFPWFPQTQRATFEKSNFFKTVLGAPPSESKITELISPIERALAEVLSE